MDFLTLFIYSFLPTISIRTLEELKKTSTLKTFLKGEQFSSDEKFYILKSGIVKSTSKDSLHKKYTNSLFISDSKSEKTSNIINLPITQNTFECLTDIELYEFDYPNFTQLLNNNLEISILLNKLLEHQIILKENKVDELIKLDTEKRYIQLLKEFPYLEKIVPKYQIAAYLNISPVQLTRIRKKLRIN